MAYRALVSIEGRDLPEPSVYSANTATLVNSARNVDGIMIGAVIRDDVAKVSLKWNYLTLEQWAEINSLFKSSVGGKFINNVTFLDQSAGQWISRELYISDRNAGMWRRDPVNGNILGWTGCALALVEV